MKNHLRCILLTVVSAALCTCQLVGLTDSLRCEIVSDVRLLGPVELQGIESIVSLTELTPFVHEPLVVLEKRRSIQQHGSSDVDSMLQAFEVPLPSITSYDVATSTINPPDNTMAINTKGLLVCIINSRVVVMDTNGVRRADRSLDAFFSGSLSSPPLSRFLCDPRVVFDVFARRFFVTAMTCEGKSTTSQIVLAVSKSENPLDGWWAYQVRPSQLASNAQSVWFDYPQCTTTESALFITANLFDNTGNYVQSFAMELKKQPLLSGMQPSTADLTRYLQLDNDPYSIYPVPGTSDASSNRAVLISNGFGSSERSSLDVYEFTTSATSVTGVSNSRVSVPPFQPPGFSQQPSSNVLLSCFDQRGASAVMTADKIHYVYTVNGPGGRSAIRYVILVRANGRWRASSSTLISRANLNLAYPSIAALPSSAGAARFILTYTFAGANENPGIATIILDSAMRASEEILIRRGDGPVDFQSVFEYGRWADYTTSVADISSPTPGVWTFAPYGNRNRSWNNALSRIRIPNTTTSAVNHQDIVTSRLEILPTPFLEDVATLRYTTDRAQHVTLRVTSLSGIEYAELYDNVTEPGTTTIQCAVGHLPSGVYAITLHSESSLQVGMFIKR